MNRRTKSSLLAVLALIALPTMSACVFLPSLAGDDSNGTDVIETDDNNTDNNDENDDTDDNGDNGDNGNGNGDTVDTGEARFSSPDDFFAQIDENMRSCFDTETQPLPETVEALEPSLAGGVYAYCYFANGDTVIGVLMPDENSTMADTSFGIAAEIEAFKTEAGVTSAAVGGNWLMTSFSDSVVDEFVEHFGGTVY